MEFVQQSGNFLKKTRAHTHTRTRTVFRVRLTFLVL